jgi:cell division protein FtsB
MGRIARKLAHASPSCDRPAVRRLTLLLERVLPVAILVVAVVGAPVLIFSPTGLPRLRGLQKELADVEDENAELRRQIESLRGRVARLRDDPAAVERIARDDLGLVRQTEVVFQFASRR